MKQQRKRMGPPTWGVRVSRRKGHLDEATDTPDIGRRRLELAGSIAHWRFCLRLQVMKVDAIRFSRVT
ncbi:MAG: hypothetical protein K1Y02_16805, partial [Candidatus Hydrogenedentes bacterium]|nr:hypothetical protein [Candidatus Hydrogenedentota bacterium]